jgi:hypothetical protein
MRVDRGRLEEGTVDARAALLDTQRRADGVSPDFIPGGR